jgi:hypothetical protein
MPSSGYQQVKILAVTSIGKRGIHCMGGAQILVDKAKPYQLDWPVCNIKAPGP